MEATVVPEELARAVSLALLEAMVAVVRRVARGVLRSVARDWSFKTLARSRAGLAV